MNTSTMLPLGNMLALGKRQRETVWPDAMVPMVVGYGDGDLVTVAPLPGPKQDWPEAFAAMAVAMGVDTIDLTVDATLTVFANEADTTGRKAECIIVVRVSADAHALAVSEYVAGPDGFDWTDKPDTTVDSSGGALTDAIQQALRWGAAHRDATGQHEGGQ